MSHRGGPDVGVHVDDDDDREAQLLLRERGEQRVLRHGRLRAGGAVFEHGLDEGIRRVHGECVFRVRFPSLIQD